MSTLSSTYRARTKVLGYPVDPVDEPTALEIIEEAWNTGRSLHVVTLNAEMVIQAQNNQDLDRIVRHAHLIIPDGAGVVWAMKLKGTSAARLPGIELADAALNKAAVKGIEVALVGGKPEILAKVQEILPKKYPGLKIVAAHDGYFASDEEDEVVDAVSTHEPRLILIALGVPKQEFFIDRWQAAFPKAVMIGVGGSFDVWSGTVKRAPKLFRQLHLEWLYRLIKEPWRASRMASTLPNFAIQVMQDSAQGLIKTSDKHAHRGNQAKKPKLHDKTRQKQKDK